MTQIYSIQFGLLLLCSVSLGCISIASSDDAARRATERLPLDEPVRSKYGDAYDRDSQRHDPALPLDTPQIEQVEKPQTKNSVEDPAESENELSDIKRVLSELSSQVHLLAEQKAQADSQLPNDVNRLLGANVGQIHGPSTGESRNQAGAVNDSVTHAAMTTTTSVPSHGLADGRMENHSQISQATHPISSPPVGAVDQRMSSNLLRGDGYSQSLATDHQHTATSYNSAAMPAERQSQSFAEKTPPGIWKTHLNEAITKLENGLYQNPDMPSSQQAQAQLYLRLLYVIANDRDSREKAQRQIMELGETERAFWNHQLFALSELLQDDAADTHLLVNRNPQLGYALGLDELRQACVELAAIATLDVKEVRFCTDVNGYGNYTEFPKGKSYESGQEVLIYFEVENFSEVPVDGRGYEKYETAFKVTTRVIDASGSAVYQNTSETIGDSSRNRRRDYYIVQHFHIPDVAAGKYKLQLSVEDLKGKQKRTTFNSARILGSIRTTSAPW